MKKSSLLLIPLLMLSCRKEAPATETSVNDSVMVSELPAPKIQADTSAVRKSDSVINNAPLTREVLRTGVMREEKEGTIIRMADAEHLPFTIGEEFTDKNQKLILNISNYSKSQFKAKIATQDNDFNIRFNQIRLPDGKMDGPFGREITYKISKKGEIWITVSKNNMAEGKTTGSFSVTVE